MEKKQLIIAIGREYGSGGHKVAEELANRFNLKLYNRNLLGDIATERHVEKGELDKYDEVPKNRLFYRTVNGYSNSPQENVARLQFDYLKKLAESGESFVIVGRCAETLLRSNPNMVSVFVLADMETKIARVCERRGLTREKAKERIARKDYRRKHYHNYYCDGKWGDSRNYDISLNISKIGLENAADVVEKYIRLKWATEDAK